jgi:hypothetical protein
MLKIKLKINIKASKINYKYNTYFINLPYTQSGFYLANLKENTLSKKFFKNIPRNLSNIRWSSISNKKLVNITYNTNYKNKSLILLSSNLHSTVGMKLTQNELNMIKLPYFVKSVMIGLLLSDGYIVSNTKSKNGRLGLTQSLSHSGYLYFVFNILAHYCSRYPVFKERFGRSTFNLEIITRSMPCITELYDNFYKNKIKVINSFIYNDITPTGLAHWIMGDGTYNGITLLLCTNSYSIKEIVFLINVLIIKYDVHCTIRYYNNIYPRIYILKRYLPKVRSIMLPYMHSSILYKLGI